MRYNDSFISPHPSRLQGAIMARQNYSFTSESVSEGHPDKVCDRISDEIVDLIYKEARKQGDEAVWKVRVACETLTTTNRVVIAGEVRVPDVFIKKDKQGNVSRMRRQPGRGARAISFCCAPRNSRHRIRAGRISLENRQDRCAAAWPVCRYRPGRGQCFGQAGRRRCRRSGHHVRLCL